MPTSPNGECILAFLSWSNIMRGRSESLFAFCSVCWSVVNQSKGLVSLSLAAAVTHPNHPNMGLS